MYLKQIKHLYFLKCTQNSSVFTNSCLTHLKKKVPTFDDPRIKSFANEANNVSYHIRQSLTNFTTQSIFFVVCNCFQFERAKTFCFLA